MTIHNVNSSRQEAGSVNEVDAAGTLRCDAAYWLD